MLRRRLLLIIAGYVLTAAAWIVVGVIWLKKEKAAVCDSL